MIFWRTYFKTLWYKYRNLFSQAVETVWEKKKIFVQCWCHGGREREKYFIQRRYQCGTYMASVFGDLNLSMEHWWDDADRGIQSCRKGTCCSAILSTTNRTWTELGSNPGLRGERPATNRLSHGTARRPPCILQPLWDVVGPEPIRKIEVFSPSGSRTEIV
jgi:hypothetical protein